MKHFLDYTQNVSKQTFSAASIVDSKGNQVGRIIIRFTDSQIGYNHQAGVIFYPAELSCNETRKGNTYSQPGTLFYIFRDAGIKCYRRDGLRVIDYDDRKKGIEGQMYDSMTSFSEIELIKHNRKTYRIYWVM